MTRDGDVRDGHELSSKKGHRYLGPGTIKGLMSVQYPCPSLIKFIHCERNPANSDTIDI